jgi:hypothetical protein
MKLYNLDEAAAIQKLQSVRQMNTLFPFTPPTVKL